MPCAPAPATSPIDSKARPAASRIAAPVDPPASSATTMAPKPMSVASQPTTNRAGAARPSMVKVPAPGRAGGGARRRAGRQGVRSGSEEPGSDGINARAADPRWRRSGPDRATLPRDRTVVWIDAGMAGVEALAGAAMRPVGSRPRRQRLDGGGRRDLTPLEVLAAPGAQRPVQADQARAVGADAVQARPAGRADDPFVVDAPLAGRAVVDRLDLGEQRFLGQVALPDLADLLVGPDDLVDPHREDEEERGEQDDPGRDEVRQDRVVRALLHVAERPVRRRDPEDRDVDEDQPAADLDDVARDDVADRIADTVEDLIHALAGLRGRG